MIILMIVTLYTSRIILHALGVEDYGIYNVVAGIVSMFSLLSSSMSVAISRFITFELGKKENQELNKVFSASVTVQIVLILIIVVIAETVGVWYVNAKMVIPADRQSAAFFLYQTSILSFTFNLFNIPYNAAIIAHERMSAFAYMGILEAVLKLATAYVVIYVLMDKLVVYGILTMIVSIFIRSIYTIYCKKKFEECTYHFSFDKEILKNIFSYAGWTYIGTSGAILRDQGGVLLINLFFGPIMNAARGISFQVQHAVDNFSQNFLTAIKPQITKSYASGDYTHMKYLISKGTRFGYYLVLILSLPILFNTEYILKLWLGNVPSLTENFVRLSIIFVLSETISNPLITAASATGKIRNYQLLVGGIQFANLPLSYILLKLDFSCIFVLVVAIVLSQLCLFARLCILRGMIQLSVRRFLLDSYFPILVVTVISSLIPFLLKNSITAPFTKLLVSTFLCIVSSVGTIFYLGLIKSERIFFKNKINELVNKFYD